MPDVATPLSAFPADLSATYPQADLVWGVLEASLTGLALYSPIRNAEGSVVDFRIDLLNPAAQRMLQQPARPTGTYLGYYPHTLATGSFAFHRDAFESGEPAQLALNYQGDGLDNYFQLSARRVGQGLLVSFTDTADAARTEVELALRDSQAQEQTARTEAEHQRNQFQALVDQAPVALGFFEGPELRVTAANQQMCTMWGHPADQILHRPFMEAVPELQGQGFDDLLRQVMATEVPVAGTETPAQLLRDGQLTTTYYDFVYKPFYDAQGTVQGVIDVAVEVTAQVVARQQLQALTTELLAANQELEDVTTAVEKARAEADLQRQQLHNVLEQAPAMICIFDGPQHTFQFVNPPYQALVGDRPIVGKPIAEAMPELAGQPIFGLLDQVYRTGETFYAYEMMVQLDHQNAGVRELEKRYYNFIYQARHNLAGAVDGILVFAYDVTTLVQARQQVEQAHEKVQHLNEELAATNEELHASNAEFLAGNTELARTQQQLRLLNQGLEDRVRARTHEMELARATTERQRRQYEDLFMRAPAAICIFDGPTWVYQFVNPGYQAMFPGRQLLGLPLLEALPEVAGQPLMDILHRVYDTGETFEGKEVLVPIARNEGSPVEDIYFDLTYQARYNEDGHIDGFITYAYDVTQQVLARRQREAQQRRLHEVFEQAPVAIFVVQGPTYRLEVVNPAMCEMLGSPMAELLGRPYFEAMPELASQGYPELLAEVWRTGEPVVVQELSTKLARHRPGQTGYFTFVYQPLHDAQGRMTDIMCVAVDVTDQVLARQQVQNLNEELAAINEELQASNEELHTTNHQLTRTNVDLDNFIYTASHDLKAPIANIEGLLLALQQELPAAGRVGQVPTMMHLMQEAIERFGRTIGHLTDVSRLQKAHAQPATEVNVARVVEEVQLDLAPLIVQTDAHVAVQVPANITLLFAEKNLRSVVYNLLSNALKYRHPERAPEVRVEYQVHEAYQVLSVQDNGLGLDLTQGQDKLFAMFQRLHTHVEGTGIGLYMVKKMVENAGGSIEVRSELGQGSTFTVYFPR
ncbi:MAG: PAS domain-containing protein [Janthinobacterium lividum]